MGVRVEWIGAASPLADERVVYRKLMGLYTPLELDALDIAAQRIAPLIRQKGSTARRLITRDGFSRDYQFGPRKATYIQEMTEADAAHLFGEAYPDSPEFRQVDNPEHNARRPIVPWAFVDKIIYGLLKEAAQGPLVKVESIGTFTSGKQLVSEYERRFDVERADRLREERRRR